MIDLDQARRRAKERLTELRATEPAARLSHVQHAQAREHGYRSWTDLVRDTEVFDRVGPDQVPWARIRRVTVVCFLESADTDGGAVVVLYRHQQRWAVPTGRRLPGEDPWDDSVLRLPLLCLGFRRQGTHPYAVDHDRRHVVFWVDGGPYSGTREHRTDAEWWTGPVAAAAELLTGQGDRALARLVETADHDRRTMSYERHNADLHRTLVGGYLRADSPEGGSGFGGTAADWREARGILADALDPARSPTTFLDLCCANGHLALSMVAWGAEQGIVVDPYGVDIAPELVDRARADHPEIADHFWVGDALTWRHPTGRRFDLVHVLMDVLPAGRHPDLLRHLLAEVVTPGGRLLVSHYGELPADQSPEAIVTRLGHRVGGQTRVPVRHGRPRGFPSVWIDA